MKLHTLEIPDDPILLAEWLEGHLMGLQLGPLVTELEVLGGTDKETTHSLHAIPDEQLSIVLQLGLRSLAREQLRQLLRQPRSLLELQRLVLEEGGTYWDTVPRSSKQEQNSRQTWRHVERTLAASASPGQTVPSSAHRAWYLAGVGWLAATAAAIALCVFVDQAHQLQSRVGLQNAAIQALRKDLQAVGVNRVEPADLPEAGGEFVSAIQGADDLPEAEPPPAGPPDLPGNDPTDLPEI